MKRSAKGRRTSCRYPWSVLPFVRHARGHAHAADANTGKNWWLVARDDSRVTSAPLSRFEPVARFNTRGAARATDIGRIRALRQEFGVAGGYGRPREELFVGLAAAFNEVGANGVVGKDFHQGFADLGLQRGGFRSLGHKNDSGVGDGRSGLMTLQADNRYSAGDARDGAASPRGNGAAEEEQNV